MCFLRVVLRRALPQDRPPARIRWDARRAFPVGRVPREEEEEEEEEEEQEEEEGEDDGDDDNHG